MFLDFFFILVISFSFHFPFLLDTPLMSISLIKQDAPEHLPSAFHFLFLFFFFSSSKKNFSPSYLSLSHWNESTSVWSNSWWNPVHFGVTKLQTSNHTAIVKNQINPFHYHSDPYLFPSLFLSLLIFCLSPPFIPFFIFHYFIFSSTAKR